MKTFDIEEAAFFLKISKNECAELARMGEIPGTKIGVCWVFIEEDIAKWLREKISHDHSQRIAIAQGDLKPGDFKKAVPSRRSRRNKIPKLPESSREITPS